MPPDKIRALIKRNISKEEGFGYRNYVALRKLLAPVPGERVLFYRFQGLWLIATTSLATDAEYLAWKEMHGLKRGYAESNARQLYQFEKNALKVAKMRKIIYYQSCGITQAEMARLLDCTSGSVCILVKHIKNKNLTKVLEPSINTNVTY